MSEVTAQLKDWRFSIDGEGIAWAIFDREGESANSLGRRAIEELNAIIERVEAEAHANHVRGLVLMSGKERGYIVGADIREFENFETEQQVIDSLQAGKCVARENRETSRSRRRGDPRRLRRRRFGTDPRVPLQDCDAG